MHNKSNQAPMTAWTPNLILIVGKSTKFIHLMKSLYPDAQLIIASWRTLGDANTRKTIALEKIDLALICGYDYSSYMSAYHSYINRNVMIPLTALTPLADKAVPMIYIDTMDGSKNYTFSRYLYAKKLLGMRLSNTLTNLVTLTIPTISDARGKLDIYSGWFTKQLFAAIQKLGLVHTISPDDLQAQLVHAISGFTKPDRLSQACNVPQAIGLQWPRPLLLDRALRIFCG